MDNEGREIAPSRTLAQSPVFVQAGKETTDGSNKRPEIQPTAASIRGIGTISAVGMACE